MMNDSSSSPLPRPSPPPRPPPPLFNIAPPSLVPPLPLRPSPQQHHQQSNVTTNQPTLNLNLANHQNTFFTPTASRRTITQSSFFNSTTRRIGSLGKGGIGVPSFLRSVLGNNTSSSTTPVNIPGQQQPTGAMSTTITTPGILDTRPRGQTESGLPRMARGSVDNGNIQLERPSLQLGSDLNHHRTISAQCLSPRPRPRPFPGLMNIPQVPMNQISPKDLSDRFGANNIINIDGRVINTSTKFEC